MALHIHCKVPEIPDLLHFNVKFSLQIRREMKLARMSELDNEHSKSIDPSFTCSRNEHPAEMVERQQ